MVARMLLAMALLVAVPACGSPGESQKEKDCREAVNGRAAQGEYGDQADEIFKQNVREAYEDCAF